ncbi:hypothetical protein [Catenulispora subtropica]|uniref:DUF4352 domain-containing protein n=1 Tax=Catenulispora subtropica TaxID=450798 RepID=A0ABN2SBR6_9ACTN
MEQMVRDEVWEQLDPRAGALGGKQRKRAAAAVWAAAVLLGAGVAVDYSGVVRAHLARSADVGTGGAALTTSKVIAQEVAVENTGWTTVRVVGVGQDGPGLRLLGSADPDVRTSGVHGAQPPFDLHPGQTKTVAVAYRVTDCEAVPAGAFPVQIRVDRPWGTQTIGISLPQVYDGAGGTAVNPPMTEWQKDMADRACGLGPSPAAPRANQ